MKTNLYLLLCFLLFSGCTHEPTNYAGEYPDDVRRILEDKCASAGCHNEKSYTNAAGLRLDRWAQLWKGSTSGSVIIPYNAANSSLTYFINSDSALGPALLPRMPLNAPSLTATEYATIKAWIAAGAPDKTGEIPFASYPDTRQKIYLTQQGCDLIAVIDGESGLIMRYINIGTETGIEIPHCVRFTPDGKYAYVSFTKSQYLQKIDATTDAVVGSVFLGEGAWNLFLLSDDGKKMMVSNLAENGTMKYIDLDSMKVRYTFEDLIYPHGIAANAAFDTFFITSQYGNTVYRLNLKGIARALSIDGNEPNHKASTIDPHEVKMSPDHSRYFLTCQASSDVRVMDARTNQLLKVIPVGTYPQEMAFSSVKPYMFVSCEEEVSPEFPMFRGVVYVIDYNTLEVVKRIPGPFYQIHGITVDDRNGKIYIASRNLFSTGPAPHHTSQCAGRNGYYSIYDLNTLSPSVNNRFESTVDPYSADVRFK